MNRYLLEYKGKTFSVESCATCPARTTSKNGLPRCEIRNARLHEHIKDLFPHVPANKAKRILACPVHCEGTKKLTPKSERIDKVPLHEKPKVFGALYCSWCGIKINPAKAVIIINDKEPDRIYHRFECLEEYLRTSDK
jgi:hypothetical protein